MRPPTCFCRGPVLLASAVLLAGCTGSVELLGGVSEAEANQVVAALAEADIASRKVPGKDNLVSVAVGEHEVAAAVRLLAAQGVPHEHRASLGEVFKKDGLISSPLEERARYIWALSQELSETVGQFDGVVRARVHVVLPERSAMGEATTPPSAAVFVKYRRGSSPNDLLPQVKQLVASSIPGLSAERVTVVLTAADAASAATGRRAGSSAAAVRPAARRATPLAAAALWGALALISVAAATAGAWWWRRHRPAGGQG